MTAKASCAVTCVSGGLFLALMDRKAKPMEAYRRGDIKLRGGFAHLKHLRPLGKALQARAKRRTRQASGDASRDPAAAKVAAAMRRSLSAEPLQFLQYWDDKWVRDADAPACQRCGAAFSVLRRRHHCRACGGVFDARCCDNFVAGRRVCKECAAQHVRHLDVQRSSSSSSSSWARVNAKDASGEYGEEHQDDDDDFWEEEDDEEEEEDDEFGKIAQEGGSGGRNRFARTTRRRLRRLRTELRETSEALEAAQRRVDRSDVFLEAAVGPHCSTSPSRTVASLLGWYAGPVVLSLCAIAWWVLASFWAARAAAAAAVACAGLTFAMGRRYESLGRRLEVYGLFFSTVLRYRLTKLRMNTAPPSDDPTFVDREWELLNHWTSRRIYHLCVRLRGFWVKLGQYVSSRADVMPPVFIDQLKQLQDTLPPVPFEEVRRTVERELGGMKLEEAFEGFEETCIATASISQVHVAYVRLAASDCVAAGSEEGEGGEQKEAAATAAGAAGGLPAASPNGGATAAAAAAAPSSASSWAPGRLVKVAVKVQIEGVPEAFKSDLVSLDRMTAWLRRMDKDWDFRPVLSEWSEATLSELDFVEERQSLARVREAFSSAASCGQHLNEEVVLPRTIDRLCTSKVLVMEFLDGEKVTDATAKLPEAQKTVLATNIIKAFAHQMFVEGVFNADPHPGNILILPPRAEAVAPAGAEDGEAVPAAAMASPAAAAAAAAAASVSAATAAAADMAQAGEESKQDSGIELPTKIRLAFAKVIVAAADQDFEKLKESFGDMGIIFREGYQRKPDREMEMMKHFFRDTLPSAEYKEIRGKWRERRKAEKAARIKAGQKARQKSPVDAWPSELVFFSRTLVLLRGMAANVGARVPLMAVMAERARFALEREARNSALQ
eukprot:g4095.t1